MYDREEEVNIYELAHKCKIWAEKEGYVLIEYALCVGIHKSIFPHEEVYKEKDLFTELFKIERVIKACQWILDNKED